MFDWLVKYLATREGRRGEEAGSCPCRQEYRPCWMAAIRCGAALLLSPHLNTTFLVSPLFHLLYFIEIHGLIILPVVHIPWGVMMLDICLFFHFLACGCF